MSDLGIFEGLSEGFEYVAGSMPIRTLLVLLGIVSMMSAPLTVLMPIAGDRGPARRPATLGLLTAALGVGRLVASLFLAARKSVVGLGSVIAVATGVFGLGMAGLSFSHTLWISLALLAGDRVCHGGPDGRQQRRVADHRRGEQAGAGDELLHDGLLRHGAAGKPAGRAVLPVRSARRPPF